MGCCGRVLLRQSSCRRCGRLRGRGDTGVASIALRPYKVVKPGAMAKFYGENVTQDNLREVMLAKTLGTHAGSPSRHDTRRGSDGSEQLAGRCHLENPAQFGIDAWV